VTFSWAYTCDSLSTTAGGKGAFIAPQYLCGWILRHLQMWALSLSVITPVILPIISFLCVLRLCGSFVYIYIFKIVRCLHV